MDPPEGAGSLSHGWISDLSGKSSTFPRSHEILGTQSQSCQDWPISDTLKTLQAFLGKCGYYCWFIANYATLSALLVQYTKQDQHEGIPNLHKDCEAVKALRAMKEKLKSAPILAYPKFHGKPFILDTDFSVDPGVIGSVLSQEQDGQERVTAYGARKLQPREQNYALTKGELLAVIFFL